MSESERTRFAELKRLFGEAQGLGDAQRKEMLARLSESDPPLANELARMLACPTSVELQLTTLRARLRGVIGLEPDEMQSAFAKLRGEFPMHETQLRRCEAAASRVPTGPRRKADLEGVCSALMDESPSNADANSFLRLLQSAHTDWDTRYEYRGELARGGMGAILRVFDRFLGRTSAMKVMLGQAESNVQGKTPPADPEALRRFLDEAQITGQLDHPGVVPVHEIGIDSGGRVFFTMQQVRGLTAAEVFHLARQGEDGWTRSRALEVLLKICDTMAYAHAKQIVHRDLKPTNVMVGCFGQVYVMDWGLAKIVGQPVAEGESVVPSIDGSGDRVESRRQSDRIVGLGGDARTMDGDVLGTLTYMAPEQAEGRVADLGPASDVYSIGAILYTLLTGREPYMDPGVDRSPHALLKAVQHRPPKPILEIDPGAPSDLVAICERAMDRHPDRRYRDASALAEALRVHLERRVVNTFRFAVGIMGWLGLVLCAYGCSVISGALAMDRDMMMVWCLVGLGLIVFGVVVFLLRNKWAGILYPKDGDYVEAPGVDSVLSAMIAYTGVGLIVNYGHAPIEFICRFTVARLSRYDVPSVDGTSLAVSLVGLACGGLLFARSSALVAWGKRWNR